MEEDLEFGRYGLGLEPADKATDAGELADLVEEKLRSNLAKESNEDFRARKEQLYERKLKEDAKDQQSEEGSSAESSTTKAVDRFLDDGLRESPEALELRLRESIARRAAKRHEHLIQSCLPRPNERPRDMYFRWWGDNPFVYTSSDPLATFAADVDTASYTLARRYLVDGYLPT
ncbi:MAG: von Willebrand factor type A domain-containing protein, partial [Planctomycetes bacterium]|nr:von Willebrand factor type A domain-containing protein [Planctomycetota bacterium]